jgi:hypothetical protein
MSGAIPPFPNTPSWRGAQLKKHGDNFNFTFLINAFCLPKPLFIRPNTHNRKEDILYIISFHFSHYPSFSVSSLVAGRLDAIFT